MVLITSDSGRDLADNQIPMGDMEMGLVEEEGGERGAFVLLLLHLVLTRQQRSYMVARLHPPWGQIVFWGKVNLLYAQWGLAQTGCSVSG